MRVPDWPGYYPVLQSAMQEGAVSILAVNNVASDEQQAFYVYWESEIRKANRVELHGNLAYIFCYYYEAIRAFMRDENFDEFKRRFDLINDLYGDDPKIKQYYHTWLCDAYLFQGQYEQAWEHEFRQDAGSFLTFELLLNYAERIDGFFIDADMLFAVSGFRFVLEKKVPAETIQDFKAFLNRYLSDEANLSHARFIELEFEHEDLWELDDAFFERYEALFSKQRNYPHNILNYNLARKNRRDTLADDALGPYYVDIRRLFSRTSLRVRSDRTLLPFRTYPQVVEAILKRLTRKRLVDLFNVFNEANLGNGKKLRYTKF